MPVVHLALVKAEYAYEAQTEDELTLIEDALYYLLEADDEEWHKVKLKTSPTSDEQAPSGLVPANYLIPAPVLKPLTAMYSYEAQTEDELTITEDEPLELMEEDGEWSLVRRPGKVHGGVGYVPTAYVEAAGRENGTAAAAVPDPEEEEAEEEEAAPVPAASVPPSHAASAGARDVRTWSVTDIDGKKKRKGTLGVGNGALFFASESDKTGVQQYRLTEINSVKTEKGKHILLTCGVEELHFQVSGKEIDAIVAKIEEGRSGSPPPAAASPPPTSVTIPPPPPLPQTAVQSPPERVSTPVARPPSAMASGSKAAGGANGRKVAFAPVGKPAVALYDFEAQGDDELTVSEGERLFVLDDVSDEDWWKCKKETSGEEGVVPASYVELDEGAPSGNAAAADAAAAAAAAESAKKQRLQEEEDARVAAQLADEQDDVVRREEAEVAAKKAAAAREAESKRKSEADAAARRKREAEYRAAQLREAERALRSVPSIPSGSSGPPPPKVAARPDSAQSLSRPQPGAPAPPKRPDSAPREGKSKPTGKVRTWRDRTGQFKVEASFLGLSNGKIRLHKLNGVIIDVPLAKMSNEDVIWLEGATGRKLRPDDDDVPLSRVQAEQSSKSSRKPTLPSVAAAERAKQGPPKKQVDWFEFFLNAGCDIDDCTRYARNFESDRIDESILPELEAATMRTLGLREGDVIRVRKFIKQKYGAGKGGGADDARAEQIRKDEELARKLSGEDQPAGIFTSGPNGALKTTRRGRPERARANTGGVDAASITSLREKLISTTPTPTPPPQSDMVPPPIAKDPKRSSSTVPLASGFDDDAWTVRPTSKPTTPKPPTPAPLAAQPAPPAAPSAPPAPAQPAAPAPQPAQPQTSLNDQIMEKIMAAGQQQQQQRAGSVPPPVQQPGTYGGQAVGTPTGASYQSPMATGMPPPQGSGPQPTSFGGQAPRGPLAPVASNAPLLNPLVPTNTGMTGFVPTRQSTMRPQQTGFMGSPMGMQPQPTGMMNLQPPTSMMGNMSLSAPQQPPPMSMAMQPTGIGMGMMQPQQTGFVSNPGFSSSMGPSPMYAAQPPQQLLSASVPAGGASTPAKSFEPGNVFASMKTGNFGGPNSSASQDASRYDALRPNMTGMPPQQTGFGSFGQQMMPGGQPPPQPLQPQPTGFAPGGYVSQPGMQQGLYPQQTGWRGF